jgi:predicted ATPase with chaperone activity
MLDIEWPKAPDRVADTGIDSGLLNALALKTLYFGGDTLAIDVARQMHLPLGTTLEILDFLRRERLCEILGGEATSPGAYRYTLTMAGIERASKTLDQSGYVGPTPVPLKSYVDQMTRQSVRDVTLTQTQIEKSLSPLVLDQQAVNLVGQALSAEKPMLLYGESGDGKTTAAECLAKVMGGTILVPHAVEVGHQVIRVYDHSTHRLVDDLSGEADRESQTKDHRWIAIQRPVVFAAGELAANHLDLVLDEVNKTYEAPIQMKANGGILVIDDFGRQRLDAAYLLNRWIIPLERGFDSLSLHNGARFRVPFDVVTMFLTNRRPEDLADEAFLRRIRYKINIPSPTIERFIEIIRRECEKHSVAFSDQSIQHFIDEYYVGPNRAMRGCHPRDIVEAIADAAQYRGSSRALTEATLRDACASYFV